MMNVGDDPRGVYCRVCGAWCVPKFPGWQLHATCSKDCDDEFHWRSVLATLRKPYRPPPPKCRKCRVVLDDKELWSTWFRAQDGSSCHYACAPEVVTGHDDREDQGR